eukprot:jgi/Bigna1/68874/fgenesh1_pg.7_\
MKSGSPLSRYTGPNLLSPSGKLVDAKIALREADIVAFYVASLSSVSEGHQKRLVEIYHQLATRHLGNLQIVFITHDKTEEEFQRHRKGMPWFSIPFSSTDFIAENSPVSKLLEKDKIRLKILTKQGEQLITCLQEEEKASIELQRVPSNMFGFDIGYSWERRFQSLTVYLALMVLPLSFVAWGFTLSMMLVPILNVPFIVYLIWSLFYDDSSSRGNRTPFLRKLPIWKLFVDYFPMRLEKTVDISPKKKHPVAGCVGNIRNGCKALGFSEKFPGIDHRLLTLKLNFKTPWVREVHQDYMKALRTLWDEHKNVTVSGIQRAQTLVFD